MDPCKMVETKHTDFWFLEVENHHRELLWIAESFGVLLPPITILFQPHHGLFMFPLVSRHVYYRLANQRESQLVGHTRQRFGFHRFSGAKVDTLKGHSSNGWHKIETLWIWRQWFQERDALLNTRPRNTQEIFKKQTDTRFSGLCEETEPMVLRPEELIYENLKGGRHHVQCLSRLVNGWGRWKSGVWCSQTSALNFEKILGWKSPRQNVGCECRRLSLHLRTSHDAGKFYNSKMGANQAKSKEPGRKSFNFDVLWIRVSPSLTSCLMIHDTKKNKSVELDLM